jgi:hypothetical protein
VNTTTNHDDDDDDDDDDNDDDDNMMALRNADNFDEDKDNKDDDDNKRTTRMMMMMMMMMTTNDNHNYDDNNNDGNNNDSTKTTMTMMTTMAMNRYDVFAVMPGFIHELPNCSPDNNAFWQPWEVNKDLFDCMREYCQDVIVCGSIVRMCRRITSRHMTLGRDVIMILSRLLVIINASTQFLLV